MPVYFSFNARAKAAIQAAMNAAALPVSSVHGGHQHAPSDLLTDHTIAAASARVHLAWPTPPSPEQRAAADAVLNSSNWN